MNDDQTVSPETIRVKSIQVTGLFGLYTHNVTINSDRVTVIHGPNGVGKTVFLRIIFAFLKGRYNEIVRIPFLTFEIFFDDESVAKIKQDHKSESKQIEISLSKKGNSQAEVVTISGDELNTHRLAAQISDASPFLDQIGPDEWINTRTEESMNADDIVARALEFTPRAKRFASKEPKGLRELRSKVNVHYIEAQRLIKLATTSADWKYRARAETPMTATVQEYARDLKRRLESTLANYAKVSQKLDQTFPQRLLSESLTTSSIGDLAEELVNIEATREKLRGIGILDRGDSDPTVYSLQSSDLTKLQDNQVPVMRVYARDTKEKLAVLEELSGRIEILLTVLNRKFTNKRLHISRESGLLITGPNGNSIPVTALSSGEQHELVLMYDLLFKVSENTLVLIDEPELSLHISWQKDFMSDLLEIISLAHFDVLMATHSPYIVGDRTDLMVILSSDVDCSRNAQP